MEEVLKKVTELLDQWNQLPVTSTELVPLLNKVIEVVERELEAFYKMNPDPFDDRHPSLSFPDCNLGHVLKAIFKNDYFMDKQPGLALVCNFRARRLVHPWSSNGYPDLEETTNNMLMCVQLVSYVMQHENNELAIVSCRLLVDVLPGLEISVVFQDTDGLVDQLFQWAESATDPLQSYATALLAAAMEIQDIAANYRENNSRLVPIMMRRLQEATSVSVGVTPSSNKPADPPPLISDRPFAHLNKESDMGAVVINGAGGDDTFFKTPVKRRKSSWAEIEPYMIGSCHIYPVTPQVRTRFILRYLVPMGEYQELLTHVIEFNALPMILSIIDLKTNSDVWMAFEALKYLAALLCHKKIAMEFINMGGLQHLLHVYRPSVAATGVSICLYYLAYCEDAMEKVCQLPTATLTELVKYVLWLMECSHDSSRCHAIMFFTLTYMFRAILDLFDKYDGLRKLYNVIGTLNIYDEDQTGNLSDDQVLSMRHTARNVCTSLRRYYEVHLVIKAQQLRRNRNPMGDPTPVNKQEVLNAACVIQALRIPLDNLAEHRDTLLELMPLVQNWKPVEELHKLGGIQLLVQLLECTFDWNYSGSSDLANSILQVFGVCSLLPKIQLALCEVVNLTETYKPVCMKVILTAAEGDKQQQQTDMEVTKSALEVIINCVCGPIGRNRGLLATPQSSGRKRGGVRTSEELLTRMWTCIRTNNGIMILLKLLSVETPITDADEIRCLACKALCGLSRCETVRQIMSKLPLFTSGQLQGQLP
ncbi:VPRBP [Cordylochernes scorpioides]|uniref:VPRBP n=1 Tax=Cordylochernes scorpioides TaxID=51811 RepID=A0ABY6L4Z5_9ARAC|nr:VPRBP [Cordylochernes scorpioides]